MGILFKLGSIALSSVLAVASVGCGAADGFESQEQEGAIGSSEEPVINGVASNASLHPYESLFVKVNVGNSLCTGTLLGNATTGSSAWVLTAKHCTGSTPDVPSTSVVQNGTRVYAKNVYPNPGLDVSLIELKSALPSTYSVYFTALTPDRLVNTGVRCFGYGNNAWVDSNNDGQYTKGEFTGAGRLRYADFTIKAAALDPTDHYELNVPNGSGQALAPGDSGGPCIKSGDVNATRAINLTGTLKAGTTSSNTGKVTYNREVAITSVSDWIRSFVPRP